MHASDSDVLDEHRRISKQLTITVEHDAAGSRVIPVGELDLVTAPELTRVLSKLVASDGGRVMIDMFGVSFMDSAGLMSLLRAVRAADANGHRFTVGPRSRQVQRLLELTGLLEQLTLEG
jgi:anti-sigma B factor antagonist